MTNHPPRRHAKDAAYFLRSAQVALSHVERSAPAKQAKLAERVREHAKRLAQVSADLERSL